MNELIIGIPRKYKCEPLSKIHNYYIDPCAKTEIEHAIINNEQCVFELYTDVFGRGCRFVRVATCADVALLKSPTIQLQK